MAEMIVDQRECVRKVTNSNIHPVCSDISRVKGLLRVLGTATCCLLVLALLPAPPASAGYVVDAFDKYAGRSRTYLAYKDDTGSIFEVRFTASQPGEQRRLRGQLELIAPKSISDDMVVARHAILRRPQHPARSDLHPETALDVHGAGAGRVPLLPVAGHWASPPVGQEDLVEHPQGRREVPPGSHRAPEPGVGPVLRPERSLAPADQRQGRRRERAHLDRTRIGHQLQRLR